MENSPALALIHDALQRLGKARLSLDLAKDLMVKGEDELTKGVRSDRLSRNRTAGSGQPVEVDSIADQSP
jgi:hypothetical protein